MHNLPLLRSKHHSKFAYPLAGFVYDNKKYEQSCFFDNHQPSPDNHSIKSKSTPYVLNKHTCHQSKPSKASEGLLRMTSRAFNITTRLSSPMKQSCSRSRWISVQKTAPSTSGVHSNSLINPTKLGTSTSSINKRDENSKVKFGEIEVGILDTLSQGRDDLKTVKLDLKRYFEAFFADNLVGQPFQELLDLIERHVDRTISEVQTNSFPEQNKPEVVKINSIRGLFQRLSELQRKGKYQEICNLLKMFCIPSGELRSIFLNDVLNLLSIQLYEQFGLNKDNEYVLLTLDGKAIDDFAQIRFSTRKLFVANKDKVSELYQSYLSFLKRKKTHKNKYIFRQTLKNSFREQVGGIQLEASPSSPSSISESRKNIAQAQNILNFKNDKTSYGRVRLIQYLQRQQKQKALKQSPSKTKVPTTSQEQQKNFFTVDEKIHLEFKKLKRICDYGDAVFKNDETCKDKILLGILVRQSIYFRTKTPQQIERILAALEFIEEDEKLESYQSKTITEQQYFQMRKIINCNSNKADIVHFVDRFLQYDQFGELHKQNLRQTLAFVIGGEKKTSQVILQTIWCWLQKNGVIINQIVRRNHMQLLYERNKLVYYFLISLIFGTSDTSALQLAQEILL